MSYIGNTPGVSSQRVVLEEVVSGSPKSTFTPISGYTLGYVDVLVNGVEVDTADFTASDGVNVTLATAAAVGDTVKIKTWLPRGLSDGYLKSEADAKYVAKAGSTMTGDLVLDNGNADGAQLQLASSGYSNWNLDNYSGRLRAYYGSTEYFTINASGNVGIGQAPIDGVHLNVYGHANLRDGYNLTWGGTYGAGIPTIFGVAGASGYLDFRPTGSTSGSVMRINSAGNVGIGTITPGISRLYVNDAVDRSMDINGAGQISIGGAGYNAGFALNTEGLNIYTNSTARGIIFGTDETERMRISPAGQILAGPTSANPFYANTKLSVLAPSNAAAAAEFFSKSSGDVGQAMVYIGKYDATTTTSQVFVRFVTGNGAQGQGSITANGASQAAFTAWSDERLKENITDLPSQLENIMSLRPVEFDYKSGGHQVGFIAQEMQEVFPDAVGDDSSEDHYLTVTGWNKTEAILVKAIQEQQAIIEQLRADVETLKGQA